MEDIVELVEASKVAVISAVLELLSTGGEIGDICGVVVGDEDGKSFILCVGSREKVELNCSILLDEDLVLESTEERHETVRDMLFGGPRDKVRLVFFWRDQFMSSDLIPPPERRLN